MLQFRDLLRLVKQKCSYTEPVSNHLEAIGISQKQGQEAQGPTLFENVSFRWEAPGLHVIMGVSGGGKSTLLKTLGGVWIPASGEVKANGQSLWLPHSTQNEAVLSSLGFAFQNNALFNSLRVIDNLSFPHKTLYPKMSNQERTELSMSWLGKVGLEAAATQFPHELSGGMQKRLSIARTLILNPDFIFLDDPTAGLDPITSKQISDLIASLLKGSQALVVIVTNDPDRAIDWGPNIHILEDKKLLSPETDGYEKIAETFR